jgi:hypothetical protein
MTELKTVWVVLGHDLCWIIPVYVMLTPFYWLKAKIKRVIA